MVSQGGGANYQGPLLELFHDPILLKSCVWIYHVRKKQKELNLKILKSPNHGMFGIMLILHEKWLKSMYIDQLSKDMSSHRYLIYQKRTTLPMISKTLGLGNFKDSKTRFFCFFPTQYAHTQLLRSMGSCEIDI